MRQPTSVRHGASGRAPDRWRSLMAPAVRLGLLLALVPAPARAAADPDSSAATPAPFPLIALDRTRVTMMVSGDRLCLEHRHLDPSTLIVRLGQSQLVPGRDFALDAAAGCLTFADPRRFLGAHLEIQYAHFPFPLATRYVHRDPVPLEVPAGAPPDTVIPIERHERLATIPPASGGRLQIRGNKSFAVRVGSNRDASLNQSLDLDVSGEVASGVELRAILTDRDLPLQPQGDTETLNELDKILLEVRSKSLAATLGDYDVQAFGGSFLSYSKRLEGVKAEGRHDGREFVMAAAVAKGEFISLPVPALEGKQGPYALTDASGNTSIVVVAGSEAVWLNGERLTRGDGNDYTIDYGRAEVTFTTRRLITRDSRIVVDFEYTTEAFERNFYVGGARGSLGGDKFSFGASVVSESDDAKNPIGSLSDAERSVLAAAGDTLRATAQAGAVLVGDGRGDYVALGESTEALRYQYVGPNRGNYEVNFLHVGLGAGDYLDSLTVSGGKAYRWVGAGSGSYEPGRFLAAPESHQILDFTGQSRLGDFELGGEFALSGLDLNTLSSSDDLDNTGTATGLRLGYSPTVTLAGHQVGVAVRAGYRDVGTSFRTLGRIRPADYAYTWNAPAGAFDQGERLRDLGMEVTPLRGVSIGGDFGSTRTELFAGDRSGMSIALDRELRGRFRLERIAGQDRGAPAADSTGIAAVTADLDRAYESGELATDVRMFTPRLRYERDERIEYRGAVRVGSGYTVFGGGTEVRLPSRARLTLDFRQRDDRVLGTGSPWSETVAAFEQSYRLEVPRVSAVSVSGAFTRRTSDDRLRAVRQVSDLIQLDIVHSSQRGGVESETHADVTTTDVGGENQELVYVGAGQGVLDEYGRYVGPGGDYVLRQTNGGIPDLRTRLRLAARAEVRPRRFLEPSAGGARRVLAALGAETTMQVDELTRLNLSSPRYFFFPSNYQREDATFRGTFYLRQDVDILESNMLLSFRVRGELRNELDNRVSGVSKDREARTTGLRVRSSPWSPFSAELEQTWGTASDVEAATGAGSPSLGESRLDLDTGSTALELTSRPGRDTRIGFLVRRQVEQVTGGTAEADILELTPSVTTYWRRARVDLRYRRVREERTGVFPPSYRASFQPGTRSEYGVNMDYRPLEHVTLTGGLEGIRLPTQSFNHTARLEVRIFF